MSMLGSKDNETRSYLEIVDALRQHGAAPKADMEALWRRIVFNILISNTDDHLRNHGFLYEGHDGWRLSPAYDLNPVPTDIKPQSSGDGDQRGRQHGIAGAGPGSRRVFRAWGGESARNRRRGRRGRVNVAGRCRTTRYLPSGDRPHGLCIRASGSGNRAPASTLSNPRLKARDSGSTEVVLGLGTCTRNIRKNAVAAGANVDLLEQTSREPNAFGMSSG